MSHEHERHLDFASAQPSAKASNDPVGKVSRSAQLRRPEHPEPSGFLQLRGSLDNGGSVDEHAPEDAHGIARKGLTGPSLALPHLAAIQASFGRHDVSHIQAHVGGPAADASSALGAQAYATGSAVAFREAPDLFTAAHEAAHVVQQRRGVHLMGGIGRAGDAYEQHADAVANAVVQGRSAEALLGTFAGGGAPSVAAVQRRGAALHAAAEPDELERLAGVAPNRVRLPLTIDLGEQPMNQVVHLDIGRLTIRDGFAGSGRVTARALREGNGGDTVSPEFVPSAPMLGNGPVDDMLRVAFRSSQPGLHSAALDVEVAWADGLWTRLRTRLVATVTRPAPALTHEVTHGEDHSPHHESTHERAITPRPSKATLPDNHETSLAPKAVASPPVLKDADHVQTIVREVEELERQMEKLTAHNTDQAIGLMATMPARVETMRAALHLVKDVRQRVGVKAYALRVSDALDYAHHFIDAHSMPWTREFAAAFDAENKLRGDLYLDSKKRPYSGTVDPKDAIKQAEGIGTPGQSKDTTAPTTATGAVTRVGNAIEHVADRHRIAIDNVYSDLGEPEVPPRASLLDQLIEVALKTALAASVAYLATWMGKKAGTFLEKQYPDAKNLATQASETVKDATKEFLKVGLYKVLTGQFQRATPRVNARQPMEILKQHAKFLFADATLKARDAFAEIQPALHQSRVGDLLALREFLVKEAAPTTYDVQYAKMMDEWQNVKAKLNAGPSIENQSSAERDVDMNSNPVDGAFEVVVGLDTDVYPLEPRLRSLVLKGAEAAARRHYWQRAQPLAEVSLNKRYTLRFFTLANYYDVTVDVGPDHGVHKSSLDQRERTVLRIVRAQRPVQATYYALAARNQDEEFSRFGDSELISQVRMLIRAAEQRFNTGSLK